MSLPVTRQDFLRLERKVDRLTLLLEAMLRAVDDEGKLPQELAQATLEGAEEQAGERDIHQSLDG